MFSFKQVLLNKLVTRALANFLSKFSIFRMKNSKFATAFKFKDPNLNRQDTGNSRILQLYSEKFPVHNSK